MDSMGRGIVTAYNVPVECGEVLVHPGDFIFADFDGVVVVPKASVKRSIELGRRQGAPREQLARGTDERRVPARRLREIRSALSAVRITSIETIPVHRADPSRVPDSRQPRLSSRSRLSVILKVHTDEGMTGLGEVSCTPVWSGEDHVTPAHIIADFLEPALVGEDPRDIERLTAKMRRAVAGHPFTKSGIEIALWDILGKAAGLPVYRLLGGAVRERVPIKMSVSGAEPQRAAELAEWAMSKGLKALKVKVGIEPEGDIARVKAVRQAIGPTVRMGMDANGGWSVRASRFATIRRMVDECDIYFAEQPVAPLDVQWMADVRRNVTVR